MSEDSQATVRLSQNQIRSNPILHSHRVFRTGNGRREQEQRQFDLLLELQRAGVSIYQIPDFIRIDHSALCRSTERIGVVGLVVDDDGMGYVTRLNASKSPTWEVSVDLPFHYSHIQNLLLRTIGDECIDDGLPELLAFKITDTLGQRCEGDSMDVAALLAVVDAAASSKPPLLDAAVAVVSPFGIDGLRASKSIAQKLDAFVREFGHGSLLVRHLEDDEAAEFDSRFTSQWIVRDLRELAEKLRASGLLQPFLASFQLDASHGPAIAAWTQHLLADESRHSEGKRFIQRLNNRVTQGTPLRLRLDVACAEEDLHRHRGDFDTAIAVREKRIKLEENPAIACYERSASSDNRHAAALYDAHRLQEGIDCLQPWVKKLECDEQICLPETRAVLKNTLARCLVAVGDEGWQNLLTQSLEIQKAIDPVNVSRTTNVLVHCLLKANQVSEANKLIASAGEPSNLFDFWLRAEAARRSGETWDNEQRARIDSFDSCSHAFGFACQAIARQANHEQSTRVQYMELAKGSLSIGAEQDATNVKRLLTAFCDLAIKMVSGCGQVDDQLEEIQRLLSLPGLSGARMWYEGELRNVEQNHTWQSVDELFSRVPHF